jgi:hypothetical protein
MIRERVKAGMKEAQLQGKHCGRPAKEFDVEKAAELRRSGLFWHKLEALTWVPMHLITGMLMCA